MRDRMMVILPFALTVITCRGWAVSASVRHGDGHPASRHGSVQDFAQAVLPEFGLYAVLAPPRVWRSIHSSRACAGTRTARPLRSVGNSPDAIIR